MQFKTFAAVIWPLAMVAQAIPSTLLERSILPRDFTQQYPYPLPSQDQFYVGPVANLASYKPGDIIRSRQLPNNLTSLLPSNIVANVAATWQLLYRTSDIFGAPAVAVTEIWVPLNGNPNKLLSYQAPCDRANLDCAASYELQNGYLYGANTEAALPANLIPITALNLGWYITLPDFEGIIAALGSGLTGAYATLDGIRATLNSASFTGISPSARIGMSGYSGGGPPSNFASELASTYAPELNLVGAVIGGINPNSVQQLNLTKLPDPQFENILGQVIGLSNAYPNLSSYLDANLRPALKPRFYQGRTTCQATTSINDLAFFFKNSFTAIQSPVMQSVWYWGTTWGLRGTPKFPLYVNQAINGPLAKSYPDGYVSGMCSKGVSVQYVTNTKSNHISEPIFGNAGGLLWMQDRLNGVPAASGCTTVVVSTTTLAPSQQTLYGVPIYNALVAAGKAAQHGAQVTKPGGKRDLDELEEETADVAA